MVSKRPFQRSPASEVNASSSGPKEEASAEPVASSNPDVVGYAEAGNSAFTQSQKAGELGSYDDDDDDDDDDELDDLLDEFNTVSSSKPTKNAHGETSAQGASLNQPSLDSLDDDFAKQLQQGMADLLKEMEESPEFQAQFDSLVQELDKSVGSTSNQSGNGKEAAPSAGTMEKQPYVDDEVAQGVSSFHDTIAKTMERMKESGAEIDTEMADSQSDDFLAEMLRQMQTATGKGGSDEDFSKMLMGMMEQLTNKEILYEPMKELDEKFPGWLVENEGKHSTEEMDNFREQARLVREIVAKFEQPSFSDASEIDREYIVERMQKMQAVGSPPAELLGDMGHGDGLPPDIENCPVQ
ncbi:Peroxisome chaperone and import receptor [Arthrobotrys megalospora]